MIKPVEIVTVKKIIPVFKEGQEANAINVINFSFDNGDECGYNVIAQKGLYELEDKAVYIQPDFCLSDIALFESFIRPNGEPNKSRLGKMNRIRAIKFNFQLENTTEPTYSFGVLLPLSEVITYLGEHYSDGCDLSELLGITKYEEPESAGSGQIAGDFPSFMYKTDEENINNIKSKVARIIASEQELGYTIKTDGSSFTEYCRKMDSEWTYGICSRSQEKKNDQSYVTKYVDRVGKEFTRYLNPVSKINGWYCAETKVFFTNEEIVNVDSFTAVTQEVKDSWVELAKSTGLIDKGLEYCKMHDVQLAFRGEIYGQGLKGSGNKLNPDAALKQGLVLFGVDCLDNGFSVRQHYGNEHNLKTVGEFTGVEYKKPVVIKPKSYDELCEICENVFKEEKAQGRVIEGLVIRTMNSNELSCKYMNAEYDAKK